MRPLTQKGAFAKDRNALRESRKSTGDDRALINQMVMMHPKPGSAEAFSWAAGSIQQVEANMQKKTPISDAWDMIKNPGAGGAFLPV